MNKVLKDYSITSAEYSFLMSLFWQEGQTQEELSRHLAIDKAATARAIMTLCEKGYVRKQQDADDRRCNRIFLTELAKEHQQEIIQRVHQWSAYMTEGMDEASIAQTYDSLKQMVGIVETQQQEQS